MSATTASRPIGHPPRDPAVARALGSRRRRADALVRILCWIAALVGLFFLASILVTLVLRGLGGLSLSVFTETTKPPGSNGGLLNAIVGSLIQTALGTLIGTPIGLMVGTYLAEYAAGTRLGDAVRFVSDVLLSAPSILIGLFVYQVLVDPFGGFSGWAGAVALA
ncbi:MAG TPA: phosphate ABC transporter permease PtsA, partial [Acetobacteraceae bacterium]|nr:phosphate ABC transporter permease PtsA [Acetobacteraceae bacterium]